MTENTDAIVKTLTVPLTPERAFRLFTEEMGDWWPLDSHSIAAQTGQGPAVKVTVTPEENGAVFETLPDGSTAPWGRVTDWQPGAAFGMTWHVGRPEAEATHVRVAFDVVADGTQVTLVHDGWPVLGEAAIAMRGNYHSGWDGVFGQCFAKAARALGVTVA